MDRVVNTFIQYKDMGGRERIRKTKRFNPETNLSDIKNWILTWWTRGRSFDLEIKDQHGKFVDLYEGYIDEYKPFDVAESTQPTTSTSLEIELRIVDMNGKILILILIFFTYLQIDDRPNLSTIGSQETSIGELSISMHLQHQGYENFFKTLNYSLYCLAASTSIAEQLNGDVQPLTSQNRFSSLCASDPIAIDEKKAGMQFTKDVNDIQRDQYTTDKTNAATHQRTGYFVRIQGDKKGLNEKARHRAVVPKLKVIMIW
jgi:hypothetical protein